MEEKPFDVTTNTIPYKNGIEWLKCECPSDVINFRCLLLNANFGFFYFELKTLRNFQKNNFEQKGGVFYFYQKSQPIF